MAQLPSVPCDLFVHKCERKESKTDTSVLKDVAKFTDQQKLIDVTKNDTETFNKEQASYDEASCDEALPNLKKSSDTVPDRELPITDSEQFVCISQQSDEFDQDQAVPEASDSGALESSQNQSPFVYDEDTMDWQVRGDDGSIVLSEVSSDSEQLVLNCCSPVDEAVNGDYQQSHLLYGQNLTEEWTRRSLVMLPSSTATENLLVEDYSREHIHFPENSSVEALADETEHQDLYHCHCYCLYCRQCFERRIDAKLLPCCDACLCTRCAEYLLTAGRPCPKCNQPIRGISPIKLP